MSDFTPKLFLLPSPIAIPALFASLLLGLSACGTPSSSEKNKLADDLDTAQKSNSTLTLNDVTLEQANEKGELMWKVQSKRAIYTKDQKVVKVESPRGVLFQDGKEVYQIQSETGEVYQDGNQVILKGKIVATDPQNGVVLRGNELEWRPKEDILVVRKNLTGEHKQITLTAQEARAFSRIKRIELFSQVVANIKDPVLQFRTEHLIWLLDLQKISADRPVQIDRYKDKKVTDKAFADLADFELKTKIATLRNNAQIMPLDPPLQIASELMSWNFPAELVISPGNVTVFHRQEKVTMTGDKGRGDLQKKVFYLTGNVLGIGEKRNSQLNTDHLTWYLTNQTFEADGNVVYRQLEPLYNLMGPKATGQFKDETVMVQSNPGAGQVVTEFIPEQMDKELKKP